MNTKKIAVAILVLTLFLCALTACKGKSTNTETNTETTTEMVKVIFSDEPTTGVVVTELVREGVYKQTDYGHYRYGKPYVYYYQDVVSNPLSIIYGEDEFSLSSEEGVSLELGNNYSFLKGAEGFQFHLSRQSIDALYGANATEESKESVDWDCYLSVKGAKIIGVLWFDSFRGTEGMLPFENNTIVIPEYVDDHYIDTITLTLELPDGSVRQTRGYRSGM